MDTGCPESNRTERGGDDDQEESLFFRQHGRFLSSIFDLDKKYELPGE